MLESGNPGSRDLSDAWSRRSAGGTRSSAAKVSGRPAKVGPAPAWLTYLGSTLENAMECTKSKASNRSGWHI